MAEKESRRVKTLDGFIRWAAQFNDGQYLFRGVPNHTFGIEASAYRRLPEVDGSYPSRLLKINQRLIEDAQSLGHDQKNGQRLSDLELLAELQHFGAATCLIDFTRNALVALWFACLQNPKEKKETNGKVSAVHGNDPARFKTVTPKLVTEETIDFFFKAAENDRYPLYQWEPRLQNNRIIAQHSVFVFGDTQIETEAECVIMQSSKQEILKSLEELSDITEASMYPDFDGFARLHAHDKPYIEPDARGYLQRGVEAHQRRDLDDAIAYYTEVIRLDPVDASIVVEAYYNRGIVHGIKDDIDRAIEDYNTVINLKPDLDSAYYNRGTAYLHKDDYDRAVVDFNMAIGLNPGDTNSYNNRGLAYKNKGDYDRAVVDFNIAIILNPGNAIAYNNRGLVYNGKGDYDHAIEDYNTAIGLNPDFAEAHYNRGLAYNNRGDYDRAIEDCNTAIDLKPNYAEAYNNRGLAYNSKGDYDRAVVDFNIAIDLNPDDAIAYNNRGWAYNNKRDYNRAIIDLSIAIDLNPNYAEAYTNRGIAYSDQGDHNRAIADYNTAIELDQRLAPAYYYRGEAWLRQGEWERAKSDLTTARDMGEDIIALFYFLYLSIADFERKHGVQLPVDSAAMLTPSQV